MTEDEVAKVETLIGYLEYLWERQTPIGKAALKEIKETIDEANEWMLEEKNLNPNLSKQH